MPRRSPSARSTATATASLASESPAVAAAVPSALRQASHAADPQSQHARGATTAVPEVRRTPDARGPGPEPEPPAGDGLLSQTASSEICAVRPLRAPAFAYPLKFEDVFDLPADSPIAASPTAAAFDVHDGAAAAYPAAALYQSCGSSLSSLPAGLGPMRGGADAFHVASYTPSLDAVAYVHV